MAYSHYNTEVTADAPIIRHTFESDYTNSGSLAVTTNVSANTTRASTSAGAGSNSGAYFNSTAWVEDVSTNGYFNDKEWTIEAWIKTSTAGGDYKTIVRRSTSSSHMLFRVRGNAITDAGKLEIYYGIPSGGVVNFYSPNRIDDDQWHHVVIVATAANAPLIMYIDGVAVNQATIPAGGTHNNTSPLQIGREATGTETFTGSIDEVAIYSQALTATRVQAHYNAVAIPGGTGATVDVASATMNLVANDVTISSNVQSITSNTSKDKYQFGVGATDGTGQTLIMSPSWDLTLQADLSNIPANSNIVSAKLRMFNNDTLTDTQADDTTIIRNTSAWSETDATMPTTSTGTTSVSKVVVDWSSKPIGWVEVDITDMVKAWYAGTYVNHGVTIGYSGSDPSQDVVFASRESGNGPQIVTQYAVIPTPVDVTVPTASLSLATNDVTVDSVRNTEVLVETVTASLQGIAETVVTGAGVDAETASLSLTTQDATVETVESPDAIMDVETAGISLQAPEATISLPTSVDAETPTASLSANEPVVELNNNAVVELDTPSIQVTHIKPTDINGEPIIATEDEDPYFVSTMRTVGANDFWFRLNERSGTKARNRLRQQADGTPDDTQAGTYQGVTIGMNEGPDGRHSVFFSGQASIDVYDPVNPLTNTDEQFSAPSTLEFSIRTERGTQYIMGGSDLRKGATVGGQVFSPTWVGPSEFWLQDGKINFRGYGSASQFDGTQVLRTNIIGFTNLDDGEWHHITVNSGGYNAPRGSHYIEIYVDGKLEIRRSAGAQGTSANETVETGNIYFGMPDMIGGRGTNYGDSGYSLPAVGQTQWFLGDMTEVVYRNQRILSEDQILLQRDNFFGVKPVYADTPEININAGEATAKGNKTRVLVIDFGTSATATFTGNNPLTNKPEGATYQFPGLQRSFDDAYGQAGVNSEKYQFFSVNASTAPSGLPYRDIVTDNQRLLDLDLDVNLDDYEILAIRGFPQGGSDWDLFDSLDAYNTPPFVSGRRQVENLIGQIKQATIDGKRLFVNDPTSATMLGIVDRVEYVPNLRERVFWDNRLGAATGFYDARADLIDPFSAQGDPDRYRDQHANTRQRVRKLVDGLTSIGSYLVSDYIEWHNIDPFGTPPYQETLKYLDRQSGLSVGDEFYMHGANGPTFEDWAMDFSPTARNWSRLNGWVASPMANVKVGSAVTSFANNTYQGDQIQVNPYKDYAVSIAVQPGDSWAGQTVQGKAYVNFTEAFTNWASFTSPLYKQILPEDGQWPSNLGGEETESQKAWDYSTHRGSWTGTSISGGGSAGPAITINSKGEIKVGNPNQRGNSDDLVTFSWVGHFPQIEVPHISMANRGLQWLAADLDLDGNANVGVETPEITATANDVTVEATKSAEVNVSTARVRVEAVEMADVTPADATVLVDAPAITLKAGDFREVIDLSTPSITVNAVEPESDILNNVDLITLVLPVHSITLYMEDN